MLSYDESLSNFAFNFNLRRYTKVQLEETGSRFDDKKEAALRLPNAAVNLLGALLKNAVAR